ncbi:hypothetical protein IC611_07460 [Proteus mirabilis]
MMGINIEEWKISRIAVMKELGGFPYGPGVAIHRYVDTSTIQECVGIFYQPNAYGFAEDGYLLPGSICAIAPHLLDIVMC